MQTASLHFLYLKYKYIEKVSIHSKANQACVYLERVVLTCVVRGGNRKLLPQKRRNLQSKQLEETDA